MPQPNNRLQLETLSKPAGCWPGLHFNMKQKFWTLAFVLTLLKTSLDFIQDKRDGDKTEARRGTALILHLQ